MDRDRIAFAIEADSRETCQREIFIFSEHQQLRGDFLVGGQEYCHFHTALQGLLQMGGNLRNRDGPVFKVDRAASCPDGRRILDEVRVFTQSNVER